MRGLVDMERLATCKEIDWYDGQCGENVTWSQKWHLLEKTEIKPQGRWGEITERLACCVEEDEFYPGGNREEPFNWQ